MATSSPKNKKGVAKIKWLVITADAESNKRGDTFTRRRNYCLIQLVYTPG